MTATGTAGRQLAFAFETPAPAGVRAHFVIPAEGASPLALLDASIAGDMPAFAIVGPAGSGKTLLGRIALASLADTGREALFADNLDRCNEPQLLLDLMEECRTAGTRLVLSGRGEPRDWARGLRDLETRLAAAPRIGLREPDETQALAVLARALSDRQLRVPEPVQRFAQSRLPPRYADLHAFVEALEQEIARTLAPASIVLARKVLAALSTPQNPA